MIDDGQTRQTLELIENRLDLFPEGELGRQVVELAGLWVEVGDLARARRLLPRAPAGYLDGPELVLDAHRSPEVRRRLADLVEAFGALLGPLGRPGGEA